MTEQEKKELEEEDNQEDEEEIHDGFDIDWEV